MTTRVKYNPNSFDSTINAAAKVAKVSGRLQYVFGTINGLVIDDNAPPVGQNFYQVGSEGLFRKATYDFENAKYVTGIWNPVKD